MLRQLRNARGIAHSSLDCGRLFSTVAHRRAFHVSRGRNDENERRDRDVSSTLDNGTKPKNEENSFAEEKGNLAQSSKSSWLVQYEQSSFTDSDAQVVRDATSTANGSTAIDKETPITEAGGDTVQSKTGRRNRKEKPSLSDATPSDPWAVYADMGVHERILYNVKTKGWTAPLRIQRRMIPELLKGNNVVASIETGQGKTGAFAIPIIQQVLDLRMAEKNSGERAGNGPKALVLTPTAELTYQLAFEFKSLAKGLPIKTAAIYVDGETLKEQTIRAQNADILIGTPGRLISHIDAKMQKRTEIEKLEPVYGISNSSKVDSATMKFVSVDSVEMLVLDEGDKLLDPSFIADVTRVWSSLPRPVRDSSSGAPNHIVSGLRQTAIVSATLPPSAHDLILRLAPHHKLMDLNRGMKVPSHIKQIVYEVSNRRKFALLTYLLQRNFKAVNLQGARILIFCRTAQRCDRIAEKLNESRWSAASLHAKLEPKEKADILHKFSSGEITILAATDIATRGLDIPDIDYVINYDVPHIPEDYVHRVGRTGRAGKPGTAITLVNKEGERIVLDNNMVTRREERALMNQIEQLMGGKPENSKQGGIPAWRITGIERRKVPGNWADQDKDLFFATDTAPASSEKDDGKKPVNGFTKKKVSKKENRKVSKKLPVRDYAEVATGISLGLAENHGIDLSSRKNTTYLLGSKTSKAPKATVNVPKPNQTYKRKS